MALSQAVPLATGVSRFRLAASSRIPAPAGTVYAIIADYQVGHPRIVPPRVFGDFEVLEGGVGAGTRIRFSMKVLGRKTFTEGRVTEPEPGRLLVEHYDATGIVTSFRVEPEGRESRVTITTDIPPRRGILGALERRFMTRFLLPLYEEELARLASVAAE